MTNKKKINDNISRKEAVKKIGKYTALTAIGTYMILNPQKSQAQSIPPPNSNETPFD